MLPLPIFLVGCPRSGTTLLRDLLRSHPRITFPFESHFIPLFHRLYGDPINQKEACDLGRRMLNFHRVKYWDLDLTPEDFADCRSFPEAVRRLFEAWAAKENKPRWGDKTPQYVRHISLLARLFPDAGFVHIVRDGRDVAMSWLRTRYEPQNLYMAARLWRDWVRQGRSQGAALPAHRYLEIRYEALVAEPEAILRQVCAFLGEEFHPSMLTPNRVASGQWVSASSIVANNTHKWQSAMTAVDRILFESVAGDLLTELGYPVEGRTRSISSPEAIFWQLHDQTLRIKEVLRRPQRWAIIPSVLPLFLSRLRVAIVDRPSTRLPRT